MTTRVPEHAHCGECGAVIPADEEVCDGECREARDARRRKKKIWMVVFYAAMAVAVGGLLLFGG